MSKRLGRFFIWMSGFSEVDEVHTNGYCLQIFGNMVEDKVLKVLKVRCCVGKWEGIINNI